MRTYVGVTDRSWASFLQERPTLEEVNFWLPNSRTGFAALKPGEPFLFKTHHPDNRIVGGGFFEDYVPLRVSEAWDFFGEGNGVESRDALLAAITRYRRKAARDRTSSFGATDRQDDPTIGCVMLNGVVWFGISSIAGPPSFAKNIVRGKSYDSGSDSVVELALHRLLGERAPHTAVGEIDESSIGPTYGLPRLTVPRMNQGAFRAVVLNAYGGRCAITGHRIRPTLQAAHIRPVADGGQHRLDNGLLLRSDIHTLFDLGYLTVDPSHRLRVSPRLRSDFGNGDDLYARAARGEAIALPDRRRDRPSQEALEWHGDVKFLAG